MPKFQSQNSSAVANWVPRTIVSHIYWLIIVFPSWWNDFVYQEQPPHLVHSISKLQHFQVFLGQFIGTTPSSNNKHTWGMDQGIRVAHFPPKKWPQKSSTWNFTTGESPTRRFIWFLQLWQQFHLPIAGWADLFAKTPWCHAMGVFFVTLVTVATALRCHLGGVQEEEVRGQLPLVMLVLDLLFVGKMGKNRCSWKQSSCFFCLCLCFFLDFFYVIVCFWHSNSWLRDLEERSIFEV